MKLRVATDRKLVIASTADRVSTSANGLTQWFEAKNVRDVTITAAPDFRTRSVSVGARPRPLLLPLLGERGRNP